MAGTEIERREGEKNDLAMVVKIAAGKARMPSLDQSPRVTTYMI